MICSEGNSPKGGCLYFLHIYLRANEMRIFCFYIKELFKKMSCIFTSTIYSNCTPFSVGGIAQTFVANRTEFYRALYDTAGYASLSKVMSLEPAPGYSGITWSEYTFDKDSGNYLGNGGLSLNGFAFTKTLSGEFLNLDDEKRDALYQWNQNRNLIMVFKDGKGDWFILGEDRPLRITQITETTGLNPTDKNGYSVTFSVTDKHKIRMIDSDYVSQFIIPFSPEYIPPVGGCISCSDFITQTLITNTTVPLSCVEFCTLQ